MTHNAELTALRALADAVDRYINDTGTPGEGLLDALEHHLRAVRETQMER